MKYIPLECKSLQRADRTVCVNKTCLLLLDSFLTSEDGVLARHLGPRDGAVGQVSDQPWQLGHLWGEGTFHLRFSEGTAWSTGPKLFCAIEPF